MNKPLIVITGASSGIGVAMAEVFSNVGYAVDRFSRNLDWAYILTYGIDI